MSIALAIAPGAAHGAGELDTSFGTDGLAATAIGGAGGANAVAVQGDGKIVVAGQTAWSTPSTFAAARFNADGTLDESFGGNGKVQVPVGDSSDAGGVLIQPNGRIVLSGVASFRGRLEFAAVRLMPDGAPDQSFGANGIVTELIGHSALAMAAVRVEKGKLVLGGTAQILEGFAGRGQLDKVAFAALRLNPDGSLDRTYGEDGVVVGPPRMGAYAIARQPDGKLLIAGERVNEQGVRSIAAGRLTSAGKWDPLFGQNGVIKLSIGSAAVATGVAPGPNGTVLLGGNAFTHTYVSAVARLTARGAPDPRFGEGGIATARTDSLINGMATQPDGKILLAGTIGLTAIRFDPDGSLDAGFGDGGISRHRFGRHSAANAVGIQADGRILLAGTMTGTDGLQRFALTRIEHDPAGGLLGWLLRR